MVFVAKFEDVQRVLQGQGTDFSVAHYRAAIRIDDDEAAPWFGIYMVQRATGNAPAADSALRKARKLAPGASILR